MTNDEQAIQTLVDAFVAGWNAADGSACAAPFAEDADFTAVQGLQVRGKDLIARGHQEILSTIFRGTRQSAVVNRVRFLRADVALVDVTFRFVGEPNPLRIEKAMAGIVAAKDARGWSIVEFRNMVPFSRPIAGPVEREYWDQQSSAVV